MSEYSKQYVEYNMPGWDWDFDIDEEFDKIQPGEFMNLICEGYGFIGIQKNLDGSKYTLYLDHETDSISEVPYNPS